QNARIAVVYFAGY
nr:RecName: Full=Flavoprotein WrbA 1 [Acinetobacter calcoaceticus]